MDLSDAVEADDSYNFPERWYDGTSMMQPYEDKRTAGSRICSLVEQTGKYGNQHFEMSVAPNGPELKVRDLRTGFLVAFSSTQADYGQSIEEFAYDYFVAN